MPTTFEVRACVGHAEVRTSYGAHSWNAGVPTQIICLVYIHVVRAQRKHGSGHVESNGVRAAKPRFVFLPSLLKGLRAWYANLILVVPESHSLVKKPQHFLNVLNEAERQVERNRSEPVHLVSYQSPISLPPHHADWGAGLPLNSSL